MDYFKHLKTFEENITSLKKVSKKDFYELLFLVEKSQSKIFCAFPSR